MPVITGLPEDVLLEELLNLPGVEARASLLAAVGLLDPQGLSQFLDTADNLTRTNPVRARRLSLVCSELAEHINAPLLIPKAAYINAQTYAVMGQLNEALALIHSAYNGYKQLNAELLALRTSLGRIHVMNELGHHQEAVAVGEELLGQLTHITGLSEATLAEATLIEGIAYQNQGICYRMMGRYEDALQAYKAAENAFQRAGAVERLADIYNNRGIILLHVGRVSEALSDFEAAAAALRQAGHTLLYAQSLINIGDAYLLLGHYARSLKVLAEAHKLLSSLNMLADEHTLLLQRGDVYLALNLYPEAVEAYREVGQTCREANLVHYHARALWGLGAALVTLQEYEEAADALAQAERLFMKAENTPMWCGVKLEQAALFAARGDRQKGVAAASQAFALVQGKEWPVQTLYVHIRLADLLQPDIVAVEQHLLAAQHLSQELALPHLHYRIQRRLGRLRRQQGRFAEAQEWLETAVTTIERLRDTVAHETLRVSFLHDKLVAYQDLLQLYLSQDSSQYRQRAFILAEQMKSRALADMITGIVDAAPVLPEDPHLAAQLHDLRADLNAVYNAFLGHISAETESLTSAELLARAQTPEQKINRLQQQADIPQQTPALSAAPSLEQMQKQIPQDICLLAYHIIDDEIMAFIYQTEEIRIVREVSAVTAVQPLARQLSLEWNRFCIGGSFVRRHMPRLEKSVRRVLNELYLELVAPLAAHLPVTAADTPAKLLVIPHGLLHQIPFHALYDGRAHLLEQFEISYAPSTTLFALCQQKARPAFVNVLIMGANDPLIPGVGTEVTAVMHHFANATVKTGCEATSRAFRAEAPNANLIHLACHGLFRADNPMFSALKLHDDWLTAADILQLTLNNSLVTLSACESGQSRIAAGDEMIGLARAFLGAGAASLVVSLWLVQDET
ncbi:MAG TPA: CHAT domain-containing protein, partial [Anaerolineae bacterium]|nr:CHAT domain-containing protein [Anaerolineae bacterium]